MPWGPFLKIEREQPLARNHQLNCVTDLSSEDFLAEAPQGLPVVLSEIDYPRTNPDRRVVVDSPSLSPRHLTTMNTTRDRYPPPPAVTLAACPLAHPPHPNPAAPTSRC